MSSDTTLSLTSFSDSTGVEDDPGHAEALLEHVQHPATSILVLNSATLTNPTSFSRRRGNRERPARGEVHYHDHEELDPLKLPVGVAVDPVVLGGSRPSPGVLLVVHGVVYDDGHLTLHQSDRTSSLSARRRVLPTPPAGLSSPTRTSRPRSSRWPSHLPGS